MADFSGIYNSIPPVTRTLLLATGAVTGPCLLHFIQPSMVGLNWYRVGRMYEIWRPFTAFFFGGGGFPLLYDVFLIYRNSTTLEKDTYANNTAAYAWTHLMLGFFILVLNLFLSHPFLFRPLLHAQTYLWCRAHPTTKVSIFGLISIPTSLYPPALIVLDLLTGGPDKALGGITGLIAGHLWWFLSTYLPTYAPTQVRRSNPLTMPLRFAALFSPASSRPSTTTYGGTRLGNQPATSAAAGGTSGQARSSASARGNDDVVQQMRHRWGGGQRLGGDPL